MHFSERKLLYFDSSFIKFFSQVSKWQVPTTLPVILLDTKSLSYSMMLSWLGLRYQPQWLIQGVICILFFFTTQESDITQLWPVPLTIFIQIWNVIEISNCFSINFKEIITTKFCTCHDSTAVMACAKLCSDQMLGNWIKAVFWFYQISS